MKIGFIGLGIMGKPMCKNLLKAGYKLVVMNRPRAGAEEVSAAGATIANSPKEVAEQTDIIITMLPNSPHVKEVVLGKDGIIEAARTGMVVIDMSSIAPLVSREIAAWFSTASSPPASASICTSRISATSWKPRTKSASPYP
jgi:2-hydroxy-3-oxopropionate reductase